MSKIKYDGFELDIFDSAKNFRKYQIDILKKYIKDPFLEVGPEREVLLIYTKNLQIISL